MAPTPEFKPDETSVVRLPRVSVDFKIPAWGLASAAALGIFALVNMWATLNSVSEKVGGMEAKLNTALASNAQILAEQQFIKYRLDMLEKDRQHPGK